MMKWKNIASLTLASVMILCLTACGVQITSISLPEKLEMEKGADEALTVEYTVNENISDNALSKAAEKLSLVWTSSDESIATVDTNGTVTAAAPGEADITATAEDGKLMASCHVTVGVSVTSITAPETLELSTSETAKLDTSVLPEDATDVTLSYESSDESVATIGEDGTVTAVAEGECTIKIKATGFEKAVAEAETKVTVKSSTDTESETSGNTGKTSATSKSSKNTNTASSSSSSTNTTSKSSANSSKNTTGSNTASTGDTGNTSNNSNNSSNSNSNNNNTNNSNTAGNDSTATNDPNSNAGNTTSSTSNNVCPICNNELVNGSCQTIHTYSGYGHCTYDSATNTVYVVCDTCGQSWPRSTFSDSSQFVNSHALTCYNEHNKSYISCLYCGKSFEEGTEPECMKTSGYCSSECMINSGYYCPVCLSALYIDGCHNCGYGSPSQSTPDSSADTSPSSDGSGQANSSSN